MSTPANNPVLFSSRVVFPGGNGSGDQPIICSDASEIRRLLLHRLEVLEAALLTLSELFDTAALGPAELRLRSRGKVLERSEL